MKKKLREVMDLLDFDELVKIERDIDSGGIHLKNLVTQKIKEQKISHDIYCSVCANRIDPYDTNNYTLVFGPDDFKKKATFCAVDCLEYFIKNLKNMKQNRMSGSGWEENND